MPADLAGVAADLVGIAHADAHQLEPGVFDDLGNHHATDETGTPDHDSLLIRVNSHASTATFHCRPHVFTISGLSGPRDRLAELADLGAPLFALEPLEPGLRDHEPLTLTGGSGDSDHTGNVSTAASI